MFGSGCCGITTWLSISLIIQYHCRLNSCMTTYSLQEVACLPQCHHDLDYTWWEMYGEVMAIDTVRVPGFCCTHVPHTIMLTLVFLPWLDVTHFFQVFLSLKFLPCNIVPTNNECTLQNIVYNLKVRLFSFEKIPGNKNLYAYIHDQLWSSWLLLLLDMSRDFSAPKITFGSIWWNRWVHSTISYTNLQLNQNHIFMELLNNFCNETG